MKTLAALLKNHEEWLMERILKYSHRQDYVKYTSTLKEAWRISIQGLTDAICGAIDSGREVELTPDEDFTEDPAAQFGIIEAKKHRERGISFSMFMGLFKYYRDSYSDLVRETSLPQEDRERYYLYLSRIFDRIEIGFSSKWAELSGEEKLDELKKMNRVMTNEKNMYLTIVESLATPVFFMSSDNCLIYLNLAAARLINMSVVPGGYYYNKDSVNTELPEWISVHYDRFCSEKLIDLCFETRNPDAEADGCYQGRIASMQDLSGRFTGSVIILSDISELVNAGEQIKIQRDQLEKALSEIKTLHGIVPICASCKKIRNDAGYWDQVEIYISEHSNAEFSHGLCPDCVTILYPGMKKK